MIAFERKTFTEWSLASLIDLFEGKFCFDDCDIQRPDLISLNYANMCHCPNRKWANTSNSPRPNIRVGLT